MYIHKDRRRERLRLADKSRVFFLIGRLVLLNIGLYVIRIEGLQQNPLNK